MKKEKISFYCEKIYSWCIDYYGASKFRNDYPDYEIDSDSEFAGEYEFESNTIFLYLPECNKIDCLIKTFIHEWIHYLQSPSWYKIYQNKFQYNYTLNPYEIQAEEIANKDWEKCFEKLKKI